MTITKGFWMGQTEVTVGAYKRFAGGHRAADAGCSEFQRGLDE